MYSQADSDIVEAGMRWYNEAKSFCEGLGQEYGYATDAVIGATAALSPMLGWEMNKDCIRDLLATGDCRGPFGTNKIKALRCLDGVHPLDVLGGHKVRAFYHAIRDAEVYNEAVIDRHAAAVVCGRILTDGERHSLSKRFVATAQIAYKEAAREVGVYPHQMQAVTWLQWRQA